MKTKVFLLLLVTIITASFTIKPEIVPIDPTTPLEEICFTISDISELENLNLEDDVSYMIRIEWTGQAVYGTSGYLALREQVRNFYEDNHGKGPVSMIIDNNQERWVFNGSTGRSNVEATMQSDPNVDCTDCD